MSITGDSQQICCQQICWANGIISLKRPLLSKKEGTIPALENAHAVAYALKLTKENPRQSILVNISGRGDKDIDYVVNKYGIR